VRALDDGFAEKAADDLAGFLNDYPDSPLAPQATLIEARARARIGQLEAAARLLTTRLDSLNALKDQALYLLGQVRLEQGDLAEATAAFRRLIHESPDSPLLLNAAFGEALAYFKDGNYDRVTSLLSAETNAFHMAASNTPADETRIRGRLLLAEAELRAGRPSEAMAVLDLLTNKPLTTHQKWEREWLAASLFLTNRQTDAALAASSNLLSLARAAASEDLLARSHTVRAEILRRAGRIAEAFAALTNNLSGDVASDWRRDAMLAVAELPLNTPQLAPAIQLLSSLTSGPPTDPTTTAAGMAVAELLLQQQFATPASSNALSQAHTLLQSALSNSPAGPLAGRAWFNLGWTEIAQGNMENATRAFQRASTLLERSPLHSLALFKLADGQHQAGQFDAALTNYLRVIHDYGGRPPVRGAVLERALYQGALAAVEAGRQGTANELAKRAVVDFPNGEFRDDTRVLYGQTLARLDPPTRARESLEQLSVRLTNSPALPEIQLAVARSYLRERNWSNALHQLNDWTRSYPNHTGIARAEFERAWAAFKANQPARAYELFTNFLVRFPDHPAAPQAQVWVGNHLFALGDFRAAEISYQLVYQRTNWPVSRLTHEARLMAGRAAFSRQGYKDATNYFGWLIANGPPAITNSLVPPELVAQAYFGLGDCFLLDPSDGDHKLNDAMTAFVAVIERFPDTREALLARGKLADCHLQRAALDSLQASAAYTNAAQLYKEVMAHAADTGVRSQAEVRLGVVLEKQAAQASGDDAHSLRKQALAHQLNVFHGRNLRPGEKASPFWVNRAGVEAARLAEAIGLRPEAAGIYEKLAETFPASAAAFRQRGAQLRQSGDP
jgi:TolA-binding protein